MKHILLKQLMLSGFLFIACLTAANAQSGNRKASKPAANKIEMAAENKDQLTEQQAKSLRNVEPAQAGTYQILAKNAQSHEVFPIDILVEIEKNRDTDKVIFLKAGNSSLIKILPLREIQSSTFVPVPEYGVQE